MQKLYNNSCIRFTWCTRIGMNYVMSWWWKVCICCSALAHHVHLNVMMESFVFKSLKTRAGIVQPQMVSKLYMSLTVHMYRQGKGTIMLNMVFNFGLSKLLYTRSKFICCICPFWLLLLYCTWTLLPYSHLSCWEVYTMYATIWVGLQFTCVNCQWITSLWINKAGLKVMKVTQCAGHILSNIPNLISCAGGEREPDAISCTNCSQVANLIDMTGRSLPKTSISAWQGNGTIPFCHVVLTSSMKLE